MRPNSRAGWLVALLAAAAVSTSLPAQQDSTSQPAPAPQAPPAQTAPTDTQAASPAADTTHMPAAVMAPTDTTQANPSDSTQSAGQTHRVKKGDTLWDLSQTYLNDPFMWPEIYRINTTIVRDPHWIYPGQVLRIPGGGVQNVAADQMEPRFEPQAVPMRSGGLTVFHEDFSKRLSGGTHLEPTSLEYAHTPVRVGEFYAAPWLDAVGGPKGQGKLVATAEIPGIAKTLAVAERLGPETRAYITLPAGIVAAKGDRLVVFNRGAVLQDGGQVMQPTAIVQVEATDNGGEATTVRIIQQYDEVIIGQGVMPLDRFNMTTDAHAAPLALGPQSHVIFVPSRAVLPSIGSYIILDATTKDGVKLGDEFTLYRPREKAPIPGTSDQVTLPEEPIALAQVVKVTDHGTTAIILDQRQPSIKEGTAARLTARMP
jgi:LysM repeat protein